MSTSNNYYSDFERKLRQAICDAAIALSKSGMRFAIFKDSKCNESYWHRTSNGGWRLRQDVNASEAVRDIYSHGYKYATECATAMTIVYYKAILTVYGDELFDITFGNGAIYLMDWEFRDPLIRRVGQMFSVNELIEGDRAYFANPDYNPDTPQWQGENAIVLGAGKYYGHGMGVVTAEQIIRSLNNARKPNSTRSAELLNKAGRPDFKQLADVLFAYESGNVPAVWRTFPPAIPVMAVESKPGQMV
ncbi:MAG: protein-glutamine gamma-glutamyltransferase [Oscillospiraceae bacterium]|nr:protein-glutamine gamma-glutamyltransferase [Oscillospiraceae bacterium]